MKQVEKRDVIIVGGGVVGCAVARELSRFDADILLIEMGSDVASGSSKANSGIVHAGYDAKPNTLKAKFNILGAAMMEDLSKELEFPFRRIGAYVVNIESDRTDDLNLLLERGLKNGVKDLEIITGDELRKREPNASKDIVNALYVPTSGIVGPYEMTIALAESARNNGVDFKLDTRVTDIKKSDGGFIVFTTDGDYKARAVINCAGVFSAEINNMVCDKKHKIIPRKGEYLLLDKYSGGMVYSTFFALPSKMGKGVLVSPTTSGNLLVGPTADDIDNPYDVSTTAEGLARIDMLSRLSVPDYNRRDVITQFSGLRAHLPDDDFIVGESDTENFYNCMGVESPGLTAAPAIGKEIAGLVSKNCGFKENKSFKAKREKIKQFSYMTTKEREKIIKENPLYSKLVCRCETVTEGEIVEAVKRCFGTPDLDAVKRRVRAGMGRCQAGFCTSVIMEIIQRETGLDFEKITKNGVGTEIVIGKVKDGFGGGTI